MNPLFISEREYLPAISPTERDEHARKWAVDPVWCMLTSGAMNVGTTRQRLYDLLGIDSVNIVNLLPPDNKPGTWDSELARKNADTLMWRLYNVYGHVHVVALGRRVQRAIKAGLRQIPFGRPVLCLFGTALILSHPSGRCRIWNNEGERVRLRRAFKEFSK